MADVRITLTADTITEAGRRYNGDTVYLDEAEAAVLVADGSATLPAAAASPTLPAGMTLTPETNAGLNVATVLCQVTDINGDALAGVFQFLLWLSDSATGAGLTNTTASGTVQAQSASGADIGALTAKKCLRVQTLADGTYTLEITDTANTGFYVAAVVPGTGIVKVSRQLIADDYGAGS